jgi:hypothetical protein
MGVLFLFIPLWRPSSQKLPWKFPDVHWPNNIFESFNNYNQMNYELIKNELKVNYEWAMT